MRIDTYGVRARAYPALVVVLPVGFVVASWFPSDLPAWGAPAGLGAVMLALLAQLGRDPGRRKQPELWRRWGGAPTTRILRHRDSWLPKATLLRYHEILRDVLGLAMPAPEDEARDPVAADEAYAAATVALLERTRDKGRFPLVFAANVDYGFRRNLWGMKPAGLAIAALGVVACVAAVVDQWPSANVAALMGALLGAAVLAVWTLVVNPGWVRLTGDAFAERLVGSCEMLRGAPPPS